MKLTFEEAKKLSVAKWECIVDHDGSGEGILDLMPELKFMRSNCPMCHFNLSQCDATCNDCLYNDVCGYPYDAWLHSRSKVTAQGVLDNIIKANG